MVENRTLYMEFVDTPLFVTWIENRDATQYDHNDITKKESVYCRKTLPLCYVPKCMYTCFSDSGL